jgi:hypothetical protein
MTTPRKTTRTTAPKKAAEPDVVTLDLDDLTMDEAEQLETILDMGIDEIAERIQRPGPKIAIFRALMFVTTKRSNPDVTMDDIRAMKVDQIGGGDPKPKPAGANG